MLNDHLCVHVFFLDHKIGRKWYSLTGGRPCEELMTKKGNDRIIELFWRKRRKQLSIKKKSTAGLQELCFCQSWYMQYQNKRHIPEAGIRAWGWAERRHVLQSLDGREIKAWPQKRQGQCNGRDQASRSQVRRKGREVYSQNSLSCLSIKRRKKNFCMVYLFLSHFYLSDFEFVT